MRGLLLLLSFLWLSTASGQIILKVTDDNGRPLEEVSIFSRDYTIQLVTDSLGEAEIPSMLEGREVLYFVCLGYQDKKLTVSELSQAEFLVILKRGLQLDEILIVGRTHDESRNIVNQVHQINTEDLALFNSQTPADALASSGQVYVQKSQMGGGSPILRGFEANKVLLVVDGIRMNNAIYRNGHLQNAITLDGSILENISVIFGPGSLMYGSDAIGGVMHFLTKTPKLRFGKEKKWKGQAYSRISSANKEKSFHVDIDAGNSKVASLTSISYSDYGDLRSGRNHPEGYPDFGKRPEYIIRDGSTDRIVTNDDANVQIATGYQQLDLMQKFLYQIDRSKKVTFNIQHSTSSDIPRYDALTEYDDGELTWAEWNYGPQKRWLTSVSYYDSGNNGLYDYFTSTASHQKIRETRKTRRFMDDRREVQDEEVNILAATFDLEKSRGKLALNYGLDYNINYVSSEAYSKNIIGGQESNDVLTRYPSGDNTMSAIAGYLSATYHLDEGNRFIIGGRWTRTELNFSYLRSDNITWPDYFYQGINSTNKAFTWSAGWISNFSEKFNIQAMVSSAFRSPNLDDMAKIRRKSDEITAPNPSLGPERSISGDLTFNGSISSALKWRATGFYTRLNDAIVRSDFSLPNGSNTIIDRGDTLLVVSNVNAEKADVYGISIGLETKVNKNVLLEGSYNWTRGRIKNVESPPLSHIPPSYGKVLLTYKKNWITSSLDVRYNLKKDITEYGGSEDNPEYATPEGSLGWVTFNIYNKIKINNLVTLDFAVENLSDIHYRPFASGVSAPGRNLILTARFLF